MCVYHVGCGGPIRVVFLRQWGGEHGALVKSQPRKALSLLACTLIFQAEVEGVFTCMYCVDWMDLLSGGCARQGMCVGNSILHSHRGCCVVHVEQAQSVYLGAETPAVCHCAMPWSSPLVDCVFACMGLLIGASNTSVGGMLPYG